MQVRAEQEEAQVLAMREALAEDYPPPRDPPPPPPEDLTTEDWALAMAVAAGDPRATRFILALLEVIEEWEADIAEWLIWRRTLRRNWSSHL